MEFPWNFSLKVAFVGQIIIWPGGGVTTKLLGGGSAPQPPPVLLPMNLFNFVLMS